jgi:uncharacterized protein
MAHPLKSATEWPDRGCKQSSVSVGASLVVLLAGVCAGTVNTVVGSGTLITFPALLAVGLPPITANVSNTVGLFPGSFVGAYGYRRELARQRPRVLSLGLASVLGGVCGAVLLLVLPAAAFREVVPALILLALLLVLLGPRINAWAARRGHAVSGTVRWPLWIATAATGVYGGYFGAAQGVVLMGFLGILLDDTVQRHNALKNVLAGLVNLVAAIVFVLTSHIDWLAAGLIAAGSMLGGLIGARVGRRLSPAVLRGLIVVIGCIAIVNLLR